jgi:hypothetical protein
MIIARQSNIELWLNDILLVKKHYNQWLLKETVRKFSNQYFLALALLKAVKIRTVYTKRPVAQKKQQKKPMGPII